jgi:hypothetical protein
VALFRGVFAGDDGRIGWRESYQITMAANAAGKLFATAGAGSIALTVWALRESGLDGRTVARRIVCLEVLLYGVYMAALVIGGLGLYTGVLSGPAPTGVTLVPAIFGAAVIAVALSTMWWAKPMERGLRRAAAHASGRAARWLGRAAEAPRAAADGIRWCGHSTASRCSPWRTGRSTSRCCGRASAHSGRPRPPPSSSWGTSSAGPPTSCRSREG